MQCGALLNCQSSPGRGRALTLAYRPKWKQLIKSPACGRPFPASGAEIAAVTFTEPKAGAGEGAAAARRKEVARLGVAPGLGPGIKHSLGSPRPTHHHRAMGEGEKHP